MCTVPKARPAPIMYVCAAPVTIRNPGRAQQPRTRPTANAVAPLGGPGAVFWIWCYGFFATAITEEKEEGTLGLLKMAGISRVSILLGKSTSRLITAILLFLVQLPFTLLAITLGGVTLGQIFAAYWALLAYMLLVAHR